MESIIPGTEKGICYICERRGHTDLHHCLHGIRRKYADRLGLTVWLCRDCHSALHDKGKYDRELEQIAQAEYEKHHSHSDWMKIFQKNYL